MRKGVPRMKNPPPPPKDRTMHYGGGYTVEPRVKPIRFIAISVWSILGALIVGFIGAIFLMITL